VKQQLHISVRGKTGQWAFVFKGDPAFIPIWRADGLEVYEIAYSVPEWIASVGLAPVWCWAQKAWRILRLW
jgi:hypothetical protein